LSPFVGPQAVFAGYNLLKRATPVADTLAQVREARPRMGLSQSMLRGLKQLEDGLLEKQRKRLDRRMRQSVMISMAF
jgi:hypothetical protein